MVFTVKMAFHQRLVIKFILLEFVFPSTFLLLLAEKVPSPSTRHREIIDNSSNAHQQPTFHCISACESSSTVNCYHIYECDKPDFLNLKSMNNSNVIAYARYSNRMNETGWAELDLVTNPLENDIRQAYFSGILEGSLTNRMIQSYWRNTQHGNECENFRQIIQKSLKSTIERAIKMGNVSHEAAHYDPYWNQVLLLLYQLSGLDNGYRFGDNNSNSIIITTKENLNINPCGLILLQLYTEFDDLKYLAKLPPTKHPEMRCSAIVKVLANLEDVLVSHTTWSTFKTMLRIMKRYTFNYGSSEAKSMAMSSYPGVIFSIDDFYITSQHLVVQETTIQNFNKTLYHQINVNEMVFEFIRNLVANRLARNGAEWAKIFSKYNGGTYNNQFMIVDYKQFKPRRTVNEGLLTILEQMPTLIKWQDKTELLLTNGYWPSYNVPYFDEIYKVANYESMYHKYGDQYTYENCGRALIFRRDHTRVTNMTTLYHLMRYNNFKHDPLSRCDCIPPYTADRAIAARNDLNDPNGIYPMYDYSFRPSAALDAKMTNYQMAKYLQMIAVSGPTSEYLPAFSWATTKLRDLPHYDQPIEWKFKPVTVDWNRENGFLEFDFNL